MYRMDEEMQCPHGRELSPVGVRLVTPQMWRKVPAGSPTTMIKPSSVADPSQIRPALLSPSAMTQLREMSATRMHRREH